MITGVDPIVHGILGNRRPDSDGGDYYWTVDLLKTTTLLDAAHAAYDTGAARPAQTTSRCEEAR